MRLHSIKLTGFKSFVDPTTVYFPGNLGAVVGPNGSGKSNIIDAVRWVMGESSAKYLRGEVGTDVIFNGSTGRKPVGQASVELLFDNAEGKLGGEYASYNQISVKRIVTQDAQSTYFLNGVKCRRKDVKDLFLGTGLGARSYAIIMQDTISRLVEAKPDELRVYIEEAAGISKYKERRRETELRMQHTRDNLERLTDLRDELTKQLNHLQRQANAAERYKVLKEEQRQLKALLLAVRWRNLQQQFEQQDSAVRQGETVVEAAIATLRSLDAEFERQHEQQILTTEQFNQVQERYYALNAEIGRLEQTKQHQEEREHQIRNDSEQVEETLNSVRESLQQDQQQLESLLESVNQLEPALKSAQTQAEFDQEALLEAEETVRQWQSQWDEFNQRSAKALQQAEVMQTRMQHLEQRQSETNEKIASLEQERSQIDIAPLQQQLSDLLNEINDSKQEQSQAQNALESVNEKIRHQQEQLQSLNRELHQQRTILQQLQGRESSLQALQQIALGQKDQSLMNWLRENQLDQRTRLAQEVTVNNGWDHAVETVLSGWLEAVNVEDYQRFAVDHIPMNLSLYENKSLTLNLAQDSLAHHVNANASIKHLLANVFTADNVQAAMEKARHLQAHESVITKEGFWFGASWMRTPRKQDEKSGVIQRQQELAQIELEIASNSEVIANLQNNVQLIEADLMALQQSQKDLQQQLQKANERTALLEAKHQVKTGELTQLESRTKQIENDLSECKQQLQTFNEQMQASRQEWQNALSITEADSGQREALLLKRDEFQNRLDEIRRRNREQSDKVHELRLELQSAKTQHDALLQATQRLNSQQSQLVQRLETLQNQLQEAIAPIAGLQTQLEEKLNQQLSIETELNAAREAMDLVEQKSRELTKDRQQAESQVDQVRTNLEQLRMASQTLNVKRATIEEQLQESDASLETLLAQLTEEHEEKQLESQEEEVQRKIARLGPINLAAIDEYAELAERKGYLDKQDADLVEALTTLENAIRKIDRETKTRFKETFDLVNANVQTLFPKIFGGGSAMLELTGEDLLETGVAIMARPPGKRNSSIHLLSGGEKALTALSLVFSLFQLNPAPFCMLDEVDAPLDDVNVVRFCNLVKEMAKTIQFIFISHNKLAIEMADQLTGVTMREPGVSRLVAVDVAEAVAMAG
ncbi:MAG: chromosome segregation protein SMC [Gammaproteobacteria bacterium]